MLGISPEVIIHKLNVDSKYKSIQQKKRSFVRERQKSIDQEVDKLMTVRFIWEVHYLDWLANVVMVKKTNNK